MPLNVRRFFAGAALVTTGIIAAEAQTAPPAAPPPTANASVAKPIAAPTSAEIMRERISKAKAFIAVKNYNAAIYELENIRRETGDQTVHGVINVLLMNSYLEQGDYARAQTFLKELSNPQKSAKPIPSPFYFAVAGQVVKGARNQLERYRALGLTISDRSLPLEAAVDVEKMRETLETVIEQTKTIGTEKAKTADAMALLEEATTTRGNLAKDDYDAKRWKDAVGEAREQLTNSRSTIINAVSETPTETAAAPETLTANVPAPIVNSTAAETTAATTAANNLNPANVSAPVFKPVSGETAANNPSGTNANQTTANNSSSAANNIEKANAAPNNTANNTANNDSRLNTENSETAKNAQSPVRNRRVENKENENRAENKPETKPDTNAAQSNDNAAAKTETAADGSPLNVGSLVNFATSQARPVYPPAARNMRMTGIVKVEVVVNENGEVAEVQNATGPSMLQRAASDAVKKWKFKPFVRAGQPVKASGFVNFNFSL